MWILTQDLFQAGPCPWCRLEELQILGTQQTAGKPAGHPVAVQKPRKNDIVPTQTVIQNAAKSRHQTEIMNVRISRRNRI
jgi:hypothetical protein